ncbi:hypothetical protein FACS18945_5290 [Bacteroidia bacterium]|nr:hypothetical protein FACS18945_5290 [Bacteroidia bacterium]
MIFNPYDWIPKAPAPPPTTKTASAPQSPTNEKGGRNFDKVLREIESRCLDIAPTYQMWRDLGFSIAAEFGENGRNAFHRLSRFYNEYDYAKTEKQYTRCLRGKQGITIATFFYLAKQAGINLK